MFNFDTNRHDISYDDNMTLCEKNNDFSQIHAKWTDDVKCSGQWVDVEWQKGLAIMPSGVNLNPKVPMSPGG